MNRSHIELKDTRGGGDIYILGSGGSMDFIAKSFFENKYCIGLNSIWKFFPVNFTLIKHVQFIEEAMKANIPVIASKHDCGDITMDLCREDSTYKFTHKRGRFCNLEENFQENINALGKDDDIFVSYSSITSAIHLAAYMGAKNIIICGHDCGYINGKSHMLEYGKHIQEFYKEKKKLENYYNPWFRQINNDTVKLKTKLKEIYKCNIHSLNPFINYQMEGNNYVAEK